ncbi:MAG: flagellar protein FlaG [Alphaproteobacteria bacterium]|nr:flagellar protein FlaG [Alphaproteobacteria bacterium]MBN9579424.1 flagellar protein FlaG [Alphaproteobacteria bacterium]
MQLEITRNDAIGAFIYTLIDKKSGEIVRQWPTEQMVRMREYFAAHGLQMLDKNV